MAPATPAGDDEEAKTQQNEVRYAMLTCSY